MKHKKNWKRFQTGDGGYLTSIIIIMITYIVPFNAWAAGTPDFVSTWSGIVTAPDSEEWGVEDFACFSGCPPDSLAYFTAMLNNPANQDRPYAELRANAWRHASNAFISLLSEKGQRLREEFPPSKDPVLHCKPIGLVKQITSPLPLRITQEADHVLMEYEQWASVRTIHMDGRAHPENPPLTRLGHSIGRYEGDALVIETVGLEPAVFWPHLSGGGMHSEQLVITERYTRSKDGKWLHLAITMTDPVVFKEAYTVVRRWLSTPNEIIAEEEECIGVAGQP